MSRSVSRLVPAHKAESEFLRPNRAEVHELRLKPHLRLDSPVQPVLLVINYKLSGARGAAALGRMAGTLRTFLRSDHAIVKPEGGEGSVSFIVERRKAERAVNGVLEAHNALSGNSGHARVTNRNISSGVAAALKRLIDSGYLREKGVVLRRGAGGQPPVLMHNQESLLQILKAVDQALTARALMPTEKKRILAELEDPRRLASTGYLLRPRTKRQRS